MITLSLSSGSQFSAMKSAPAEAASETQQVSAPDVGEGIQVSNSLKVTDPLLEAKNVKFTAVYRFDPDSPPEPTAKNEYRIYLEQDLEGAGSFNRTSGAKAEAGSNVYLRAYNNQGFRFLGWYEGEVEVSTQQSFYYTMPAHHVTLTAHYRYDPDSPADPQSNQTDIDNRLIGDVNGDGVITVADAVCIINFVARKNNEVFIEDNADVNDDGVITVADAVCIINIVARRPDGDSPVNPD